MYMNIGYCVLTVVEWHHIQSNTVFCVLKIKVFTTESSEYLLKNIKELFDAEENPSQFYNRIKKRKDLRSSFK